MRTGRSDGGGNDQTSARLREPGRVLLVSCYELGHQPIGLASPLAFLERAGFAPAVIDLATEKFDPAAIARADFVGFSVPMHTAMRIAMRAAARVRELNPSAHICFYGLYAPLHRELLQRSIKDSAPLADSVIGGEYELALVAQIEALSSVNDFDPAPPPVLLRLPFATPSRSQLRPLDEYAHLVTRAESGHPPQLLTAGYTEASRGCLHRCTHCPIPAVYDGRFFIVPVEIVLEDVRRQVAAGAKHITLGDPDFLNGPTHALAVARSIHREFPSLSFDVTIKVEHILRRAELFPELRSLGCLFVTTAVESLSDRVLRILQKDHDGRDIDEAIRIVRAAGIAVRPTFVPFTPFSTLDEHLALLAFLEHRALLDAVDPVQLIIRLLVPPGSLLLAHPEMQQHLGALDPATLSYAWTHPDPRMDRLQRASATRVALGEAKQEPARVTYLALRQLAYEAAGRADEIAPGSSPAVLFPPEGAPKLTESWFC